MLKAVFYSLPQEVRRGIFSLAKNNEFNHLQDMRRIDSQEACYSFKPFDQHQCIFVHIPKAAGISICKTLFGNLAGAHTSVRKYQIIFSEIDFDNYFKFTFVRNPWDRVFSAYNFLKGGGICDADKKWAESNLSQYQNFEQFVRNGLNQAMIKSSIHLTPQYDFLCLPGQKKICVDFVGFFENIHEDFLYIRDKLGLSNEIKLTHENPTIRKSQDYITAYTPEMRQIIREVYSEDIKLFGYEFDNSSLSIQLKNRLINV